LGQVNSRFTNHPNGCSEDQSGVGESDKKWFSVHIARRAGGQGLGLTIVKQIVEAHKGQVWAEI